METQLSETVLVDYKPQHIGYNEPLGTYSVNDSFTDWHKLINAPSPINLVVSNNMGWKLLKQNKTTACFPWLSLLRPAGASWGPRPRLLLSAAPGCGSDGRPCRRSPPPPWRRGCPRRVGSRWPSSRPCPGRRGSRRRSGDNGQRRPLSPLCQRERWERAEFSATTRKKIKALHDGTHELEFVCLVAWFHPCLHHRSKLGYTLNRRPAFQSAM